MTSTRKTVAASRRLFQSAGFTLIELLVVIAIIAILAAILTPAIRGSMQSAQERKAMMEIGNIVSAAQGYYSEYGVWPVPRAHMGGNDRSYFSANADTNAAASQARVIKALRGMDPVLNPRGITFLTVPESSMVGTGKGPATENFTAPMSYFLDPWGNPYIITFDLNFDEDVTLEHLSPYLGTGNFGGSWIPVPTSSDNPLKRTRIAVYSLGPAAAAPHTSWNTRNDHAQKLRSAILSWKQ